MISIKKVYRVTVEIPENVWCYIGYKKEFHDFNENSGPILGPSGHSGVDASSTVIVWGETLEMTRAVAFEKAWKEKISVWTAIMTNILPIPPRANPPVINHEWAAMLEKILPVLWDGRERYPPACH